VTGGPASLKRRNVKKIQETIGNPAKRTAKWGIKGLA
jgi:hypothetical protein